MTAIILPNLPMAQYVGDDVGSPVATLSSSLAHVLLTRSALHAWNSHPRLNPAWGETSASRFDLGSAVHAILLEGKVDALAVGDYADWRTKNAQAFRAEARAAGKIPVLVEQATTITSMVARAQDKLLHCPDLAGIDLSTLEPEQTIVFDVDGVMCRCRPDWIAPDLSLVVSYKTVGGNADPLSFTRTAAGLGYDTQSAFEMAAIKALTGREPHYVWLAGEVEEPFAVSLLGLSPMFRDFAARKFERALLLWRHCMETGQWPAYPDRIAYLDPPAWALTQWGEQHEGLAPSGVGSVDDL